MFQAQASYKLLLYLHGMKRSKYLLFMYGDDVLLVIKCIIWSIWSHYWTWPQIMPHNNYAVVDVHSQLNTPC